MPTLEEVHRKFGEASEAAQLLETELGNVLLEQEVNARGLGANPDPITAQKLLHDVNRQTLGRLLKRLGGSTEFVDDLSAKLTEALRQRNRLAHAFFREHNLRRNSKDGRAIMYRDLESIHEAILCAYVPLLRATSGIDPETPSGDPGPVGHLPI